MATQVNRAEQLWKNWEDKQKELENITGLGMDEKENLRFKYDFLRKGLYRITNPSEREKLYLHVVKTVTARLEKKLYPVLLFRLLHRVKTQLSKPGYLRNFERNKQENLGLLKAHLKSVGLDFFARDLESMLDYESPKVDIGVQSRLNENEGLRITIEMEKDRFGSYLFTGYEVTHIDADGRGNTANFSKESQISLTEATNLLQGRAILKSYSDIDGKLAKKWMQLDFSGQDLKLETFSQKIDYDLKKILIEHGSQLDFYGFTKEAVQQALEQGNLISFEINGKKFHLQTCPGERSLRFLDNDKKPISFFDLKERVNLPREDKSTVTKLIRQNAVQPDKGLSITG